MKIYIDGKYFSENNAKISVFDHGLLYGDGVFEGIRAYNGRVFKLEEHIDRLFDSAKAIMLKIPMSKEALMKATADACWRNRIRNGYIRLVVTRGKGDLGLSPTNCKKATVIIIAAGIKLYPEKMYRRGLEMITVPTMRMPAAALNPAIKSLNYLNNILAKIEAQQCGVLEAIMLNSEGYVAECTGDNVFAIRGGRIRTPPVYAGALGGITRQVVFQLAREHLGVEVEEVNMNRYDLYTADECFVTGTAAEIIPFVKLDGRVVGNGKPGEMTRRLIQAFRELTQEEGYPIRP
ncbi:MAG: branched-chain-amino-acid transaminase [Verrucomicrobiae bacterium]|nr:branched-chain-amino-acid transaminase [Verrucomicrobiae bacterium]